MHKINNLAELHRLQIDAVCYIVITDKPKSTAKVHHTDCPHVNYEYFQTKVVDNEGENGGYFWSATIQEAKECFQPTPCLVCASQEEMTALRSK